MAKNLVYKEKQLAYQPFHETLERIHNFCSAKQIPQPFSEYGFEGVMASRDLTEKMVNEFSSLFRGEENMQEVYKSVVRNNFKAYNRSRSMMAGLDDSGNPDPEFSVEGVGAAAPAGGYTHFHRLNPVMTAGYLARSRAIEFYNVIHDDKPTFYREFNIQTVISDDKEYSLPDAIRDGVLRGAMDLPLCEPLKGTGLPHIVELGDIDKNNNAITTKKVMIKVGSKGNLMSESGIAPNRYALERAASIDYIAYKIPTGKKFKHEGKVRLVKKPINRVLKEGLTSEISFSETLKIKELKNDNTYGYFEIEISARIDLDSGEYRVMMAGTDDPLQGIHFHIRVTNIPNNMDTLMGGNHKWNISFEVENKRYASIPIIPEMEADFNAGGEGVSWVSFMTDQLTEAISGIRNLDLEGEIDDSFELDIEDFEMYIKLKGFKYSGPFYMANRYPGGSDDYMAPSRNALRDYVMRIFQRAEKHTSFDNDIQRQWIIMGNDEDTMMFMENPMKNDSAHFTGEGSQSFRYGFSCDDNYGFSDMMNRRVRIIGSRDNRWTNKPLTAVLKTTTVAAPTTIYFPYSIKVASGISPEFNNRPAMLFFIRDAKRISTMCQARFTLEDNNEFLYSNMANFAAGFPKTGQPDT